MLILDIETKTEDRPHTSVFYFEVARKTNLANLFQTFMHTTLMNQIETNAETTLVRFVRNCYQNQSHLL